MRAIANNASDPGAVPGENRDAGDFHRGLPGYAATPVHDLARLAAELGVGAVLVKDESDRLGLPAFKILGASWAVELTLREHPATHTLVAASAGNHGRAVAHAAAARGLRCRVYLPARSLPVRRDAISGEGAEVTVVDGTYEDAVAQADAAAEEPGVAVVADTGGTATAHWVIDGYATLFAECAAQARYDVILVPVGVGSLAAAAARHGARTGAHVIGVEPVTAACLTASLASGAPAVVDTPGTTMAGLDCAEVSPAAWPSLKTGITGTITVDDGEVRRAMDAAGEFGLAIGESGAAPLAALRALATDQECAALRERVSLGPASRLLLIATEGRTGG